MPKYAISINEETLDLIRFLCIGASPEPKIEDNKTVFIFEIKMDTAEIRNREVSPEDFLYDANGHMKDPSIRWLIS